MVFGLLGFIFVFSHVYSLSMGMTVKLPEVMICFLILAKLTQAPWPKNRNINILLIAMLASFIFFPFFSNLVGFEMRDELTIGANSLGIESMGRYHPLMGPWIMLLWNLFSFLTVYCLCVTRPDDLKIFFKYLLIAVFFHNIYALAHGYLVNSLGINEPFILGDSRHKYSSFRAQGFFMEPLNFGHFLIYLLPIFFFKDLGFKSRFTNFIFVKANFILACACLAATFSASAVFAAALGYLTILVLSKRLTYRMFIRSCGIVLAVMVPLVAVISLDPVARKNYVDKVIYTVVFDPREAGGSLLDRIYRAKMAWNIFLDHRILGSGLGTSGLLYNTYAPHDAYFIHYSDGSAPIPLNDFLRLLAETGSVGFFAFVLFACLYIRLLKRYQHLFTIPELLLYGGGFIATLFACNLSNLFNVYFIWVFLAFSLVSVQERLSHGKSTYPVRV